MSLPRLTTRLAKLEEAQKRATGRKHPPRLIVVYEEDPPPVDRREHDRGIRVVYAAEHSRERLDRGRFPGDAGDTT